MTTGPLISVTVLFAKFAKGTIRQEYPQATAQRRKYEDHAHTLAFLLSSGPPQWLSPLIRGSRSLESIQLS